MENVGCGQHAFQSVEITLLATGVDYVRNNAGGSSVAVLALSGGVSTALDTAVNSLVSSGVPTVVSAGNSDGDACNQSPSRAAQVRILIFASRCIQWRRHGGGGPPMILKEKRRRGELEEKGEEKKKGGGKKKKKKGKKERKKTTNKQTKNPVMAFCVQDNAVFIHEFSKILPIGWVPRSVASLPRFDALLSESCLHHKAYYWHS